MPLKSTLSEFASRWKDERAPALTPTPAAAAAKIPVQAAKNEQGRVWGCGGNQIDATREASQDIQFAII